MRVIINGKSCLLPDEATVAQAREQLRGQLGNDQILQEGRGGTQVLADQAKLQDGAKLWSIPKIVKGAGEDRFAVEVELLRQAAGTRSEVVVGTKTISAVRFGAVLIKNVSLSKEKFGARATDLLFLMPPQYPSLPPIGCYLNYKWPTADGHFTLQAHHGAPFLGDEGWYWYCVSLGGFAPSGARRCWRPGSEAGNGHNLVPLFIAARHAINND